MRTILTACALLFLAACGQRPPATPLMETGTKDQQPTIISLDYVQKDIQKQFDTLYKNHQSIPGIYDGFIEQALATSYSKQPDTITQDVLSSMYYNQTGKTYDCITQTTFHFKDGVICASGIFNMAPGTTIAPDHDFPITGGSGNYRNIYGTYTRKYRDSVYHVELRYYKQR